MKTRLLFFAFSAGVGLPQTLQAQIVKPASDVVARYDAYVQQAVRDWRH